MRENTTTRSIRSIDEIVSNLDCTNIDEIMINSQINSEELQSYSSSIINTWRKIKRIPPKVSLEKRNNKITLKEKLPSVIYEFNLSKSITNKAISQYCLNKFTFQV